MRILFLCHRIPYPADKGDKIRALHELKALSDRHEIDLFTLADDPADLAHAASLQPYCRLVKVSPLSPFSARVRALPSLLTRSSLTVPYFFSTDLDRAVREALNNRSYDRVFVYCSAMAQYAAAAAGIPMVLDTVDVDSDKWLQYATHAAWPWSAVYRREGHRLGEYEADAFNRAAAVLVTTEREARLVRSLSPTAHVHVMPNGVDTDYFDSGAVPCVDGPPSVVFTGDMSYFPNEAAVVFFAADVLPRIRRVVPDARFLIVGRNPTAKVRRLALMPGVCVTGLVPDVRPWLAQAQVGVAPFSIAAGIQNKILEAMAFGLPVVATSRAAQGLTPAVAESVAVADDAGSMATAVLAFLTNPGHAESTGREARRRVTSEYTWKRTADRLSEVLEQAGANRGQDPAHVRVS